MTQSGPMIISPGTFSRGAKESAETLVCRGKRRRYAEKKKQKWEMVRPQIGERDMGSKAAFSFLRFLVMLPAGDSVTFTVAL